MAHVLKNDLLELHIDGPHEGYGFTRFDWTGKITQVWYKGIPLTKMEVPAKGDGQILGKGFYNEFGIEEGLGFAEAVAGEWFHKIGVGSLKKEGEDYRFGHPYQLRPANFSVEASSEQVVVRCTGEKLGGYAYALTKTVYLIELGFAIDYALKNTGVRPIITDEYVHNFLGFGGEGLHHDYCLTFPFPLLPGKRGATVNEEGMVRIGKEGRVDFLGQPQEQFFFSELSAGGVVPAAWELTNAKLGIGIRETGGFVTKKINLWGWQHVVSPELFVHLDIAPGKTQRWSRSYGCFDVLRSKVTVN